MSLKIDILCHDGSPLGVTEKSISGEDGRMGVGGAELALLTLCNAWQNYKHYDVTLYNNPSAPNASSFKQRNITEFIPFQNRDILIVFRSPHKAAIGAKGKKIWFSTDQYTVGNYKEYAPEMDEIVLISPFHKEYFKNRYNITNVRVIDLPVRCWEYERPVEKIPKRCIFTSIPDRGLMPLRGVWEEVIKKVPDATLTITSDWRLWATWVGEERIRHYKVAFARIPGVKYRAAIPRSELIKVQLEAQLHVYPCTYDELFCIAVAESQVAGVYPISSMMGALPTTNMGTAFAGNPADLGWQPRFAEKVVEFLLDPNLSDKQRQLQEIAKKRFSIETVCSKWDEVFNAR